MFFKVKKRSVDVEKDRFDRIILIIHNLILTDQDERKQQVNFQSLTCRCRLPIRTTGKDRVFGSACALLSK